MSHQKLPGLGWEVFMYPAYCLDLAPSDNHLFFSTTNNSLIKNLLQWKHVKTDFSSFLATGTRTFMRGILNIILKQWISFYYTYYFYFFFWQHLATFFNILLSSSNSSKFEPVTWPKSEFYVYYGTKLIKRQGQTLKSVQNFIILDYLNSDSDTVLSTN